MGKKIKTKSKTKDMLDPALLNKVNVLLLVEDDTCTPIAAVVGDDRADIILDNANETYNNIMLRPKDGNGFVNYRIPIITNRNYIADIMANETVAVQCKVYPEYSCEVKRFSLVDRLKGTLDPEFMEPYCVPMLFRGYDDTTVNLTFRLELKPPIKNLQEVIDRQAGRILKRFEKAGITPKKLSTCSKAKLLQTPHSTFQDTDLFVFTTDKNKRLWLKTNGLEENDHDDD